ncbi:MAG TPA: porin [Solimonas sp.]|nr:porin [Solimonas sp.]
MNSILKYGALAVFVGATGIAHADPAETKGGITVKTEDGRFEAKVGGRIHWDTNTFEDNDVAADSIGDRAFASFFRRARITLEGKAYGWTYKFENDFAGQDEDSGSGFREMWIGTKLGSSNLRIGQAKPYRAMEELTSSNEILFMERPFSSASGIYRQFQQGLFLDSSGNNYGWGISAYNLKSAEDTSTSAAGAESSNDTDGLGAAGRVYFAPLLSDSAVFHVGASSTYDKPQNGKALAGSVRWVGRKGPSQAMGTTTEEQSAYGLELAGKAGPFYAQGEYVMSEFAQVTGDDQEVDTYYVQASWLITGETKPYDIKKGVFKNPKPNGAAGAWELKVRYDVIELDAAADREVTQLGAGLNWYVNPNTRFMVEYIKGDNEPQTGTDVSGSVITTRAQFSF